MKTKVRYKCEACGDIERYQSIGLIESEIDCECGKKAKRIITPPTAVEGMMDTVSYATQTMLHSNMPSGKTKTLI